MKIPPLSELKKTTSKDVIFDLCPHPMWIYDI